jgi:hypothetical protein
MSSQVVDTYDVRTDPRTQELLEEAWNPRHICASITAPIRLHGDVIGLICCDHAGSKRLVYGRGQFCQPDEQFNRAGVVEGDFPRQAVEMAVLSGQHDSSLSICSAFTLNCPACFGTFPFGRQCSIYDSTGWELIYRLWWGVHKIIGTLNVHCLLPGEGAMGRSILTCKPVQIADVLTDQTNPFRRDRREGFRSVLAGSMLRGKEVIAESCLASFPRILSERRDLSASLPQGVRERRGKCTGY